MVKANGTLPLYHRISDRLGTLIEQGVLRPGDRIPSVRQVSRQNKVSITTAVQALMHLENRGLVEARPQSGFYVTLRKISAIPEPGVSKPPLARRSCNQGDVLEKIFEAVRHPDVIPLGAAVPHADLLPVDKLARTSASISRSMGRACLLYDMPPGSAELRRMIARHSLESGCQMDPDHLITTNGCSEALNLALRAVAQPGDSIVIESPTYYGLVQGIESMGLKAVGVATAPESGMDLDALEILLRRKKIAAVLVVSNFNNPLGSCMPEANKRRLLELLRKRDIPLIEDDLYGDLHFDGERPRPIKAFDTTGHVLLCSSFSKTLAPGYRVGWIDPGRHYQKVKNLKFINSVATASLPQLTLAEFLKNGGYAHHLRRIRRLFERQVATMSHAVADSFPRGIRMTRPRGGFVLWVEMPKAVDAMILHGEAIKENISIAPGSMFSAQGCFRNFIRLNCGNPWSAEIERGVAVLGHLVKRMSARK